ncbi:MAG TPA: sugar ABC transporter ATP-binding protein [Anaeromyxobacter sp.]|nr:sugar ABC transporter ATP-binding protein [Anaeromyxobacter sp.]
MANLLEMTGIQKSFFGVPVLKGVDFDLRYGEVHVLLGGNGAGKSTLMKILCGAYSADAGTMSIAGRLIHLATHGPLEAENAGVATVYQNFHLAPHLSVAENLSLGRFVHHRGLIRWREVHAFAQESLARVGLAIDTRMRVSELPVSQKQMLEIAIALSKNARLLIMDEPTAALSRRETETLFRTIRDIKAKGIGVIYISHKLEEVKQVGDRISVLRDGARVATLEAASADLAQVIGLMIGKELAGQDSKVVAPAEVRPAAFEVEDLTNEEFSVPFRLGVGRGEILGITGLVGSGKTELARALFGIDPVATGRFRLGGRPVRIDSPRSAVRLGLGYLSEDRDVDGLCMGLGVKENVSLVLLAKLKGLFLSLGAERRAAQDLVRSVGLKVAGVSQQVKYLSGGNKQKVVFGKWLRAGCRVLILDEPTMGIDVGARADIYQLIRKFVAEEGRAVIFISSDVDEILQISDRILVMAGRRLAGELSPGRTSKQEILQHATQVGAARGTA